MTSPTLELPELQPSQSQPNVTVNAAHRRLEAATQLVIVDRGVNAPPASPAEGARYIVGTTPTGVFVGHNNDVAFVVGGAWAFLNPIAGWIAYVADEALYYSFNGSAWVTPPW